MKFYRSLLILGLIGLNVAADTAWETYQLLPAPENAMVVESIEYTSGTEGAKLGYLFRDLDLLRIQVVAGDKEAFRLTYRLTAQADGALLEYLYIILGRAIRTQPRMFLAEVSSLGLSDRTLESVLYFRGETFVDRYAAQ